MNEKKYRELIEKLNNAYSGPEFVSPTRLGFFGGENSRKILPDTFFVKANMDIEQLTKNNLYLLHTMLHKFYAVGKNKTLSIDDIKKLHKDVSKKINY